MLPENVLVRPIVYRSTVERALFIEQKLLLFPLLLLPVILAVFEIYSDFLWTTIEALFVFFFVLEKARIRSTVLATIPVAGIVPP